MKVKLNDGYEVEILEANLNDWKMLKLLRYIERGEPAKIVDVVEMLLGVDGAEALEKHLEVNGKTSIEAMIEATGQIMDAANQLKN